ncbi:hypothetical protein E2C01_097653 [Portunus trituberculatus]|uniref:Uncharacterized protein n=1 Tax=Portunus trituberculatus TaxID=210409 RepID=A0A5B7KBY4_PORTR|nr:hypothetical protein [Portunus trituberculatus]
MAERPSTDVVIIRLSFKLGVYPHLPTYLLACPPPSCPPASPAPPAPPSSPHPPCILKLQSHGATACLFSAQLSASCDPRWINLSAC